SKPPLCELYCSYLQKDIREMKEEPPCGECFNYEIKTAVLYCRKCGRWYPVINGIPHMLPDYIRKDEKKRELEFLRKYEAFLPEKITKKAIPHNLSQE
ncbi:MAG: Trm112 family protein, partial [Fervidicoccaceae archaeon]